MSVDPAHIQTVSLHLSRVLDEVGLNEITVKRRRHAKLYIESAGYIFNQLIGIDSKFYHFGSQTEGTTTPGLHSDIDVLGYFSNLRIIQDWVEWTPGKTTLLMLHDNTAPGYCRLQRLYSDIPFGVQDLPDETYTYDSSGRVILKNTCLHRSIPGMRAVRNGPARSDFPITGVMDSDIVMAFKYSTWPEQAKEFIRRQRRHGWPSQQLIQEAVQHGIFLVPVGYKLSETEELEWRLSASLAERCLMFSLSTVHIKCYVVLKMLIKTFVEPRVRRCISSYHCKTALLYCVENTELGFWRDDNLLQCVTHCLTMLLTWITDGFCPQFMISSGNLFAGKVTAQNRGTLMSVLTGMIRSNGTVLLHVHIDDLGRRLRAKLSNAPSVIPVLDSLDTLLLTRSFEKTKQIGISWFKLMFYLNRKEKATSLIKTLYHDIEMLKNLIEQSDRLEQQTIKMWTQFVSSLLGSVLASVAMSRNMRVSRQALRLLRIGAESDCAATLKLASVFYCSGDVQRADTILQRLEEHFCRNQMQEVCVCLCHLVRPSLTFGHMLHVLKGKKRAQMFAHCVRFSLEEIHCTPPVLRHEMFRSVSDAIQHTNPLWNTWMNSDRWMDLAAIDCLPYLYYLRYITYRQLRQRDLQTRALFNMYRCIIEDNDFGHPETAWNLLGQCMEVEQRPDAAMACYKTSLQIRPMNNAANWHVQNLLYTRIRKG